MKRRLVLLAGAALLGACAALQPTAPDGAHNARNAQGWAGTYRGVLPCADCEGIETVVVLAADGGYRTQAKYLGKGEQVFTQQGRFTWNAAGNAITLAGDEPAQYAVGENTLTRLAMDGSRITGTLAQHYVLTRDAAETPAGHKRPATR